LPGGAHLEHTVPPIAYDAALNIQQDHDAHLEHLIPALAYSRISEMSGQDLSGRAIRFKLTPAVEQVVQFRGHLLAGLEQADEIALTLGMVNGIFRGLGTFEAGDFEHGFAERDVLPAGSYEEAQTEALQAQAFGAWTTAGLPLAEALQRSGYSEQEAIDIVDMAATAAEAAVQRQQAAFGGDQGQQQDQQQQQQGPPNA
jgi:hypothetical protein